jgi:multidrug resistance efflux pump
MLANAYARLTTAQIRWIVAAVVLAMLAGAGLTLRPSADPVLSATVRRGTLAIRLMETGILQPARSISYHSPLVGREAEVVFLAPEGTHVRSGDLVVRLDTTGVERELERAIQTERQMEAAVQLAEAELEETTAELESVTEGERALEVEEAAVNLRLGERRLERLRAEFESLEPLLERGYITRDELERSAVALEQAEAEFQMLRRRVGLLTERTYPRDQQRARLEVARRQAGLAQTQQQLVEASEAVVSLQAAVTASSLYARRPGLVVYEEYMAVSPPRKVRVGDRVTASQGLVTIPEVSRMLVQSSVRESDVHSLKPGQAVAIRADAFPDVRLQGKVASIGALARDSAAPFFGDKRFDLVVEVDPAAEELRPEMTARLDILVGERPDVLLVPVNAVFDRTGVPVVHVLRGRRVETRPVELGASSEFEVEVVAGLREGERVSLTDRAGGTTPAERLGSPGLMGSDDAHSPSTFE